MTDESRAMTEQPMDWRNYIEENYHDLRAQCRRLTRDEDRADDAMAEVVVRMLPNILANYDSKRDPDDKTKDGRAPLREWVNYNVRWYVYKWLVRQDRRKAPFVSLASAEATDARELGATDDEPRFMEDVEFGRLLYATMERGERDLCVMRYVMGLTIREIAERCSWSVGYTHLRIVNATEYMAEVAEQLLAKKLRDD